MKPIERNSEGVRELRLAWQKSRSVAAEGGYLDLLSPNDVDPRGLDWAIGNEKTLDMLLAYEDGSRELDDNNWRNLCMVVSMSANWTVSLAARGCELPAGR